MYYCKWNIYFFLLIAILATLSACDNAEKSQDNFYFDSGAYIKLEIDSLKTFVHHYNNTVTLNGESEIKSNIPADSSIYKEMNALFKRANINNAILQGEYSIDTFWIQDPITQANIEVLNYTTQNEELNVRWLQVYSNGSIKASLAGETFLFSYEKEIFYEKNKKFTVLAWQKTLGQDTLRIYNSLEFL
jgi:hypothetical protein